jgi:hypothetical protein
MSASFRLDKPRDEFRAVAMGQQPGNKTHRDQPRPAPREPANPAPSQTRRSRLSLARPSLNPKVEGSIPSRPTPRSPAQGDFSFDSLGANPEGGSGRGFLRPPASGRLARPVLLRRGDGGIGFQSVFMSLAGRRCQRENSGAAPAIFGSDRRGWATAISPPIQGAPEKYGRPGRRDMQTGWENEPGGDPNAAALTPTRPTAEPTATAVVRPLAERVVPEVVLLTEGLSPS